MIEIGQKNQWLVRRRLERSEDTLLRQAFGSSAVLSARPDGLAMTERWLRQDQWLFCDCNVRDRRPPIMFPKSVYGIQREGNDRDGFVEHDEDCEFARDAGDQRRKVRTYRRSFYRVQGIPKFRLAHRFNPDQPREPRENQRVSQGRSRPGVASLLCELLTSAGLDTIRPDEGDRVLTGPDIGSKAC